MATATLESDGTPATEPIRVSVQAVMDAQVQAYQQIIANLVKENAVLTAGHEQLSARLGESESKLTGIEAAFASMTSQPDPGEG